MITLRTAAVGALLVALLGLGACAVNVGPEGFATYRGRSPRAISPEGVVYRERTVDNDPEADVAFWMEALRRRQENAGYRVVAETELTGDGLPARVLELEAPLGAADYTYLIAIVVDGAALHIVEAAGPVVDFETRRAAILTSIEQVRDGR